MCGAFEKKEKWYLRIEKIIYTYDTATENCEFHDWSLKIKI